MFVEQIQNEGCQVFESTVHLIEQLRYLNIKVGIASASKNCKLVLEKTGIAHLFDALCDGVVSQELQLKGKKIKKSKKRTKNTWEKNLFVVG